MASNFLSDSVSAWRIGIIGTGNVAWHLAHAFAASGLSLSGILVRNELAAKQKGLHHQFPAPLVDQLENLANTSDLLIVAVNDDSIAHLVSHLHHFSGIVCHTAGSIPISVLNQCPAGYGVFYPLQTLSKEVPMDPSRIPLCLEASDDITASRLALLAQHAGFPSQFFTSRQRLMLHISAVLVCNFTNHLITLATQLTHAGNLDQTVLEPLIHETIRKALSGDPKTAQTGPALRGDTATINRHLELLESYPHIRDIYRTLSASITQLHNQP